MNETSERGDRRLAVYAINESKEPGGSHRISPTAESCESLFGLRIEARPSCLPASRLARRPASPLLGRRSRTGAAIASSIQC